MTRCGVICTCVIIIIAMAALVICSVRGEKGGKPSQSLRDSSPDAGEPRLASPSGGGGIAACRYDGEGKVISCA